MLPSIKNHSCSVPGTQFIMPIKWMMLKLMANKVEKYLTCNDVVKNLKLLLQKRTYFWSRFAFSTINCYHFSKRLE